MNTREFIDKWLNHKLKPIRIDVGKYHHITCNAYHLWHYSTCIARWWTLDNGKKVLFINNTNYGHWSDIIQAHGQISTVFQGLWGIGDDFSAFIIIEWRMSE